MANKLFQYRPGMGVVPLEEIAEKQSFHSVIGDEMSPTLHPVTGEVIESKSKFRRRTKDVGCVEVGNDLLSQRKREAPVTKATSEGLKKFLWDSIDRAYHNNKG